MEDDLDLPDAMDLAEELDPDWREHFIDARDCVDYYLSWMGQYVKEVVREMHS